jgi:hypothetical protein
MKVTEVKSSEIKNLDLLAKKIVEGFITGIHKSPFHGFSVEFSEHKLYNTGESTRHIDWKLFALKMPYYYRQLCIDALPYCKEAKFRQFK